MDDLENKEVIFESDVLFFGNLVKKLKGENNVKVCHHTIRRIFKHCDLVLFIRVKSRRWVIFMNDFHGFRKHTEKLESCAHFYRIDQHV